MAGHRHNPGSVAGCQQGLQDLWTLLVGQHADHPVPRPRCQAMALGVGIELGPQGCGRRGVVGAVDQQRLAPPTQLLQPARPAGGRKAGANRGAVDRPAPLGQGLAQAQGHGAIGRLHRTRQTAGCPLAIDQQIASRVLSQGFDPVQLGTAGLGLGVQHGRHLGRLGSADRHRSRLQDTGFFGGDAGQIGAQKLTVIEADAGQADHPAVAVAGGGIKPAAQPHLEHHQGQTSLGKRQKRRRRHQLKRRQFMGPGHGRSPLKMAAQVGRSNRTGPQPDALGPAHQVRRGVQPGVDACCQQDLVHQGADRAFAIGAGHLHGRKLPLGMAELGQGRLQPLESQIDAAAAERFDQIGKVVVATTQHRRGGLSCWRQPQRPAEPVQSWRPPGADGAAGSPAAARSAPPSARPVPAAGPGQWRP